MTFKSMEAEVCWVDTTMVLLQRHSNQFILNTTGSFGGLVKYIKGSGKIQRTKENSSIGWVFNLSTNQWMIGTMRHKVTFINMEAEVCWVDTTMVLFQRHSNQYILNTTGSFGGLVKYIKGSGKIQRTK